MKKKSIPVLLAYILFGMTFFLCLYLISGFGIRVEELLFEKY